MHTTAKAWCGLPPLDGSSRCEDCKLRSRAFCGGLDRDELRALEAVTEDVEIRSGRMIFFEGDPAEYIFNVFSGTAKTFKLLPDGRRQVLGFMIEGDLLGYSTSDEYTHCAETLTPVRLCRLSRQRLTTLAARFPALESKLLQITADELTALQSQAVLLGRKTAQERIASFLIGLSEKSELAGSSDNPLTLAMSRHDIADYLGLTAETVSRVLTQFARAGLISIPQPYQVHFERFDELRRLAEAEDSNLR